MNFHSKNRLRNGDVYLIRFLKEDGTKFYRFYSSYYSFLSSKIGKRNNFGWLVLNIYVYYNGRFINHERYDEIHQKEFKKDLKRTKIYFYIKDNKLELFIIFILLIILIFK